MLRKLNPAHFQLPTFHSVNKVVKQKTTWPSFSATLNILCFSRAICFKVIWFDFISPDGWFQSSAAQCCTPGSASHLGLYRSGLPSLDFSFLIPHWAGILRQDKDQSKKRPLLVYTGSSNKWVKI